LAWSGAEADVCTLTVGSHYQESFPYMETLRLPGIGFNIDLDPVPGNQG
jgi:hypothetical protein